MLGAVRVKAKHTDTYRPDTCDEGILRGVGWCADHKRVVLIVLYDNGVTDYIPLSELDVLFEVLN